jgi:hypothetical protein
VQRPILYLGEINDSQKAAWTKTIEVFDTDRPGLSPLALLPREAEVPAGLAEACGQRLLNGILTLQQPIHRLVAMLFDINGTSDPAPLPKHRALPLVSEG